MSYFSYETHRYKSNFNKVVWGKIKRVETNFPDWSYEELIRHGYGLRYVVGSRQHVEIYNKTDSRVMRYRLMIGGQIMPHVAAMIKGMYNFSNLTVINIKRTELNHMLAVIRRFDATLLNGSTFSNTYATFNLSAQQIERYFNMFNDPMPEGVADNDKLLTPKAFIKELCINNRPTFNLAFPIVSG